MTGRFVISLDFELHWGGVEKWDLVKKRTYFLDTRESIIDVLQVFNENNIRATWATVGFLFAKNKKQLLDSSPELKPSYTNQKLSYYNYFDQVGDNEIEDPFHFGHSLINKILATPGQELGSHTFSHYYCNEFGQTVEEFRADLIAAQLISKENFGVELKSLVFPRNQYNPDYLEVVKEQGIKIVRSNPDVWFWKNSKGILSSFYRAIDTLATISSPLSFDGNKLSNKSGIIELPASRFLRPYKEKEKLIQHLKIKRIKCEMTYAAINNLDYHLWWHPHNFGENVNENIKQLKDIINHYKKLEKEYNFQSKNMADYIND